MVISLCVLLNFEFTLNATKIIQGYVLRKKKRIKCIDSEKIEEVLPDSEENRSNCESEGTKKHLKESCSKDIEGK